VRPSQNFKQSYCHGVRTSMSIPVTFLFPVCFLRGHDNVFLGTRHFPPSQTFQICMFTSGTDSGVPGRQIVFDVHITWSITIFRVIRVLRVRFSYWRLEYPIFWTPGWIGWISGWMSKSMMNIAALANIVTIISKTAKSRD